MNDNYNGNHWTHNKYRHNGKWVAMPKDVMVDGKPALAFGKEIVFLPGILSIKIDCSTVMKYRDYDLRKKQWTEWYVNDNKPLNPCGKCVSYNSAPITIEPAEPELTPEQAQDKVWVDAIEEQINPPVVSGPLEAIKAATHAMFNPPTNENMMSWRQKRYLYVLTGTNYKRELYTKELASALIEEHLKTKAA